jgi:hypothetical protein
MGIEPTLTDSSRCNSPILGIALKNHSHWNREDRTHDRDRNDGSVLKQESWSDEESMLAKQRVQ